MKKTYKFVARKKSSLYIYATEYEAKSYLKLLNSKVGSTQYKLSELTDDQSKDIACSIKSQLDF